jgi:sortase A
MVYVLIAAIGIQYGCTLSGSYRYLADSIQAVDPEDTEVLDNSDDAILTLVTCYPFYFVGSASKRFIVRAHRIPL